LLKKQDFSDYQAISAVSGIRVIRLFISLLAQRNEPKKGPPVSLVPPRRDALRSSMLPGLCKLAALKQCKALFRQPLRCSAAANGILTAMKAKDLNEVAW
jgi:hypothetical protein